MLKYIRYKTLRIKESQILILQEYYKVKKNFANTSIYFKMF